MTVVWFRQDLRVEDHPALYQAMQEGPVVPLYIHAPQEEGKWPPGRASRWWLHRSLLSLEASLKELGLKLIIRTGNSLEVLQAVMKESGSKRLFWSRRYEPMSILRDQKIKEAIPGAKSFKASLLFEPWELPKPYKVFTPFYKACLKLPEPERPLPVPKRGEGVDIPSEKLEIHSDLSYPWEVGEASAKQKLLAFPPHYALSRDRPDLPGTSRLAPHLHFGEISPRQVWHAVKDHAFLRQLIWREFTHHLLYYHPETPNDPLKKEWRHFKWENNPHLLALWQQGQTGFPIVDAGMRELLHTGWMHNRVRMIVGSFLVKDLLINWEEGARWFWDHLVDADLANNTFGWQWVAGCGADAAPFFRIFNPTLQAEKFDPDGAYRKQWGPYGPPILNHDEARKKALAFRQTQG